MKITFSSLLVVSLTTIGAVSIAEGQSTCSSSRVKTSSPVSLGAVGGDIVDTAVSAGSFNTLAAALQAADLVNALKGEGPFTVFAPTDEAFAKLPAGTIETLLKPENKAMLQSILLYHVVPGEAMASTVVTKDNWGTLNGQRAMIKAASHGVMIDNARIVKTDVGASNGVIHVIDAVIIPETKTIPELAASTKKFETLLAATKAAGLAETLMGEGPYTVFAPTDEAFARLPEGTLEQLLMPENREQLAAILTYHVVSGRVYADDAINAQSARTVEGSRVRIALKDGQLMVNDARVVMNDVEASNGVVHVIDRVILPQ